MVNEDKDRSESAEVKCPKCHYTMLIRIPKEDIPKCPECGGKMVITELLDEGKSY